MTVLDASFLIALERGNPKAITSAERLASERTPLWIPAVAWMELLSGAPPARQAEAAKRLADIGSCVPLSREIAEVGATLQCGLVRAGRRLGWNDVQVAATALHLQQPLVTFDRDFSGIAGLQVLKP